MVKPMSNLPQLVAWSLLELLYKYGGNVAWSDYPVHSDFNVIVCTGGDTILGVCNSFPESQRK